MAATENAGIYKRGSRHVFIYRANGKQRWESARTLDEARRKKSNGSLTLAAASSRSAHVLP